MKFITPIYFISSIEETDDAGDGTSAKCDRKVFACKRSISQSEFYHANSTDLKPEVKLIVRGISYKGESELRLNDEVYRIIRTYDNDGLIELTCSRMK